MSKKCEHKNVQIQRTIKVSMFSDLSVTYDKCGEIDSVDIESTETNEPSVSNTISFVMLCKDCEKSWSGKMYHRHPERYKTVPLFVRSILKEEEGYFKGR